MMDEDDAREELKRADHLIYVSLKYTRTADVILSVIKRLARAQEITIDAILKWLEDKKKIKNVDFGKSYKIKLDLLKTKFKKDETVNELIKFYESLMIIMKSKHIGRDEFRKNLRLVAQDSDGEPIDEINTERLKEYYRKTEELINKIDEMIG